MFSNLTKFFFLFLVLFFFLSHPVEFVMERKLVICCYKISFHESLVSFDGRSSALKPFPGYFPFKALLHSIKLNFFPSNEE